MVFQKVIVVDTRGHLLGRLASMLAKELLMGQSVVCVRCEEINISGTFMRNKLKYAAFLRKRTNTNPKFGPVHYRSPAKILWRTIRGMLPHKSAKGQAALERLKVFEGIPAPYDKMKRMVIPDALRVTRLNVGRRYCLLGRISAESGWNYGDLVDRLEDKRKTEALEYYAKKKAIAKARSEVEATVPKPAVLTQSGY